MTYNPAIPNANDIISQSQSQIKTNFGQADIIFDVNHITFDNATVVDRGKHRKVDFIRQTVAPGSAATQLVLYEKLVSTNSELFFQRDNVATEVQLTSGNPTIGTNGSTFLPGGIILKWGTATVTNTQTVNFITPFPTACFQVILQPINNQAVTVANDYVYVASFNTTSFNATAVRRITLVGNTVNFSYIAIGN